MVSNRFDGKVDKTEEWGIEEGFDGNKRVRKRK